jgi:hypothetical protein
LTSKDILRRAFVEEMKSLLSFRGHGFLYLPPGEQVYDWEVFTDDEIKMVMKLISMGSRNLHFIINSSTNLDIEYENHFLKTDIKDEG